VVLEGEASERCDCWAWVRGRRVLRRLDNFLSKSGFGFSKEVPIAWAAVVRRLHPCTTPGALLPSLSVIESLR
jgi:hypothetical protein